MSGSALEITRVSPTAIRPHPENPREGDLEAIKRSLTFHGQYQPLVVRRESGEVLVGNHRLLAARELGWSEIEVVILDVDEEQARRILLTDNRTSDLAGYDEAQLASLLVELDDLEGTGYDQASLDALLDEVAPTLPLEADEVEALPAEPSTRPGDIYQLGRHRLMCGDARDSATYEALLEDHSATLVWTDPPYGIHYEGRTAARLRIQNDRSSGLESLLCEAFVRIDGVLSPGSPIYIASPAGPQSVTFISAFLGVGWTHRQNLIWVKNSMVLSHADYHYRHEALLYGFKPGPGRLGRGGGGWFGDNRQTSVLEVDRPRASREHPTMKPPELIEICLKNSSQRQDLVLDPFAGSGSTLVACERLGRAARLIELDPRYCDVIIARFERLTGETAKPIEGA